MAEPDPLIDALKQRRAELGISLYEVSRRRGLAPYGFHISRMERRGGNPTLAILRSWAEALGCDLVLVPLNTDEENA